MIIESQSRRKRMLEILVSRGKTPTLSSCFDVSIEETLDELEQGMADAKQTLWYSLD